MADTDYLYKLKKNRVALVRDLIPDPIADHLLAEDVISQVSQSLVLHASSHNVAENLMLTSEFPSLKVSTIDSQHTWLTILYFT